MSKLYDLLSAICGKIKKPDWNQNDPTAPNYVKNRPFYTGNPVETVLVEEITVEFENGFSGFQSTFEATVGETYKVYWDGAAYECTCVDFRGMLAIGNLSIRGAGSDTGEPFLAVVSNGVGIEMGATDDAASHTISISGLVTEVVKVDEKYLPTIPADKLPEIPVEKLPEIPVEKLPEIASKTIPVIEIEEVIYNTIGNLSQPHYTVKNLSYADMLEIFNSGICLIKDGGNRYYSSASVEVFNGSLHADFVCKSKSTDYSGLVYVSLACRENSTRFFRNLYYKISGELVI